MISVQVRDEKIRLRTPRSSPSFPQEIRLSQWGCDIVLLLLYGSAFTEGSRPVKKKKRRVKIGGAMQPEPLIREDREMVRHVAWKKERLVYEKSAIIVVKPDESKYPPELRLLTADEALSWTIMGCCKHPHVSLSLYHYHASSALCGMLCRMFVLVSCRHAPTIFGFRSLGLSALCPPLCGLRLVPFLSCI
ncbi:hypothetical protein HDV63DRAFT_147955 [Trichoderma sp. SZMC 28014]